MSTQSYVADPTHSTIGFTVRHMVVSKVRGRFGRFEATVELDPADPARSSVTARIEAASIDTGVPDRDTHLRSPDFLATAEYPEILFRSTSIDLATGATEGVVHGLLTIRGVTRPIALQVEFAGTRRDPWGQERTGFSAHATVDRKAFGVHWNQALEAGGLLVGDQVEVEVDLEAVPARAAA